MREIVFVLSSRLKKDAPSLFYKSATNKKRFFNKKKRFVITRRFQNYRVTEFYILQEEDNGRKYLGRFL